ncbi:MAG: DUF2853 family protein [Saprospiraceae bacterium]
MTKFEEKVEEYYKIMTGDLNQKGVDKALLTKVTEGVGANIFKADASKVSTTDPEEVARVRNSFLIEKLGCADSPKLDAAIEKVTNIFGSSNKSKHRAIFYYLLVIEFNKESVYK